jgi:hypothetical protein
MNIPVRSIIRNSFEFLGEVILPTIFVSCIAIGLILMGMTMGVHVFTKEAIKKGLGQHNAVTGQFEWITHSDKNCPYKVAEKPLDK